MADEATKGRALPRRIAGAALVASLLAVGAATVARRGDEELASKLRPEVVLGEGVFAGMPWELGVSHPGDGNPCIELAMDAVGPSCSTFHARRKRHLRFYTSSGGDPSGIKTAQGLLSPAVADVIALSGGREVGEVHLFDLPERTGGDRRAVIAFVRESQLADGHWVAIAYDSRSRQIGRRVLSGGF